MSVPSLRCGCSTPFGKAVIDEKRHAFFEHLRERAYEALRGLLNLGAIALGQLERTRGS